MGFIAGFHSAPHMCKLFPEMCSGWWCIQDPETLDATLKALHPRGIREKALHKHLNKHRDFLQEVCLRPSTGKINTLTQPELKSPGVNIELRLQTAASLMGLSLCLLCSQTPSLSLVSYLPFKKG